jgi:hypothetical protein
MIKKFRKYNDRSAKYGSRRTHKGMRGEYRQLLVREAGSPGTKRPVVSVDATWPLVSWVRIPTLVRLPRSLRRRIKAALEARGGRQHIDDTPTIYDGRRDSAYSAAGYRTRGEVPPLPLGWDT